MIDPEGSVNSIDFEGDDGPDRFLIEGSVNDVVFDGGADADVLVISEFGSVGDIQFEGDTGADVFDVFGSVSDQIDFSGGADSDRLRNLGSGIQAIRFYGFDATVGPHPSDDRDLFLSRGSNIGSLFFQGDAGADVFQVSGSQIDDISFEGDFGADAFIVDGTDIQSIDFDGVPTKTSSWWPARKSTPSPSKGTTSGRVLTTPLSIVRMPRSILW